MTTSTDSSRASQLVLGLGLPLAILAVAIPWFLYRGSLPDPLASHFELGGQANRSASVSSFFLQVGVLAAIGMALCVATAVFSPKMPRPYASFAALLGGFLGGLGSGILTVTAITQKEIAVWTDAPDPGAWTFAAIGAAALLGVVGARVGTSLQQADRPASADGRPSATNLKLSDGERAVWAATQNAPWVLGVSLIVVAIGIVGAMFASWPFILLVIIGVGVSALASVHVRADHTGLHLRYGYLPWPRTDIAIDRIAEATVVDVRPMQWGGWGYRGSLKLMDQAAVIHRAGPGLRVDLTDGKVFVVTIDDPDGGAAVLTASAKGARQPQAT